MRYPLAVFAAICLVALSSCSKDSNNKPTASGQPQAGARWELTLTSSCKDADKDHCIAGYGFKVDADGKYQVGPAPNGQVRRGTIPQDDLKEILDAMENALADESCSDLDPNGAAADVDTELSYKAGTTDKMLYKEASGKVCFAMSTLAQAEGLHGKMLALAGEYYALPFPHPCWAEIDAAKALYQDAQKCQSDKDCSYVDSTYAPIPAGQIAFVPTANCTQLDPMIAGNSQAVLEAQMKLLQARDHAKDVCGPLFQKTSCSGTFGLQNSAAPPVCHQGYCKANPSLGF